MKPRTLGYLLLTLASLGLTVDAVMDRHWFGVVYCTFAAFGMAFHATHPQEWWDAKANQIVDRLERER